MEWKHRRLGLKHPKGCKFFKKDGSITNLFKIALLFTENKTRSSRKEILLEIGIEPESVSKKGYYASIFGTLTANEIIFFDGKKYTSGTRFKEYLEHCAKQMVDLGFNTEKRKLYKTLLKETSQALHFILA